MRITPNHFRLRMVAVVSWITGSWLLLHSGLFIQAETTILPIFMVIGAAIIFALGIAFWLLGTDRRAGIVLDSKGLMLNLGNSAAFVDWDNIQSAGITRQRTNFLALGSRQQIGLQFHEPERYLQSYEVRLPASNSFIAKVLRGMQRLLAQHDRFDHMPNAATLAVLRSRTGYDVIIPEALMGRQAEEFLDLIEYYRDNRTHRRVLHAANIPMHV